MLMWLASGVVLAIVLPAAAYGWSIRRIGPEPLSGAGWLLVIYYGLMVGEPVVTTWALQRVSVPAMLLNCSLFFIVGPLMAWAFVSTARRTIRPPRPPLRGTCRYNLTG